MLELVAEMATAPDRPPAGGYGPAMQTATARLQAKQIRTPRHQIRSKFKILGGNFKKRPRAKQGWSSATLHFLKPRYSPRGGVAGQSVPRLRPPQAAQPAWFRHRLDGEQAAGIRVLSARRVIARIEIQSSAVEEIAVHGDRSEPVLIIWAGARCSSSYCRYKSYRNHCQNGHRAFPRC